MKRPWLALPSHTDNEELLWVDVVPGVEVNGIPVHHGHQIGPDCDCHPRIEMTIDKMIIIHKEDA